MHTVKVLHKLLFKVTLVIHATRLAALLAAVLAIATLPMAGYSIGARSQGLSVERFGFEEDSTHLRPIVFRRYVGE